MRPGWPSLVDCNSINWHFVVHSSNMPREIWVKFVVESSNYFGVFNGKASWSTACITFEGSAVRAVTTRFGSQTCQSKKVADNDVKWLSVEVFIYTASRKCAMEAYRQVSRFSLKESIEVRIGESIVLSVGFVHELSCNSDSIIGKFVLDLSVSEFERIVKFVLRLLADFGWLRSICYWERIGRPRKYFSFRRKYAKIVRKKNCCDEMDADSKMWSFTKPDACKKIAQ